MNNLSENVACSIIDTPGQVASNTEILFTCFMARHCYPLVSVLIHPYYEKNVACSIIGTPGQVASNTEILFTCFMARHCYPLVSVLIHPYYEKLMAP